MARKKPMTTITLDKEIEEKLFFFTGKRSPLINEIFRRLLDGLSQDEIISLARKESVKEIADALLKEKIVTGETISESKKENKPAASISNISNKYQDWW